MAWKLAEAKNKFSEVFRLSLVKGPQRIERRDEAAYVISEEDYQRLQGKKPSFKEFLFNGPDLSELDLERDKTPLRDLDL